MPSTPVYWTPLHEPESYNKPVKTEFRKAALPDEIRGLVAFDRKVFSASDRFPGSVWKEFRSYWMVINDVKVGCCAFQEHVDFQEDIRADRTNPPLDGSLFIASTGILPKFQGMGLGRLLKSWEIAYARYRGFDRIVTNMRKKNHAIFNLNQSFHFATVRTTPRYYSDPTDSTVVMELLLR